MGRGGRGREPSGFGGVCFAYYELDASIRCRAWSTGEDAATVTQMSAVVHAAPTMHWSARRRTPSPDLFFP
jgi:hypothetical protein